MNERKYASKEEALAVAKEAVWLAWQAVGGPFGWGVLQDNPNAQKEEVWKCAVDRRDYNGSGRSETYINCDYVFGRMMKLRFEIWGDKLNVPDFAPRGAYQEWCHRYKSFDALFDAAEKDAGLKVAA